MGNQSAKKQDDNTTTLTEDDIIVLMENTKLLDRDGIVRWHLEFLSDYPGGYLTKQMFVRIYRKTFTHGDPTEFGERVFRVFDADKSGKISFREFMLAVSVLSNDDMEKRMHGIFKIYDLNNNGRIERREMERVLGALYDLKGVSREMRTGDNAPDRVANRIYAQLNVSRNGQLSENEFVTGCLSDKSLLSILLPSY